MVQVYEDPGTGQQSGDEWSFKAAIAKGLAGAIGILAALAIDYIQKGDASALLYVTKLINATAFTRFHVSAVPPYIYLAVLLIAGFAMVYIFEPTNKRNAFYAGAGVLGFLATFSPIAQQTLQIPSAADLPSLDSILDAVQSAPAGTPAAPTPSQPATPAPADGGHAFNDTGLPIIPAAYRPVGADSQVVLAQAESIPVNIVVLLPAGAPASMPEMRVTLHVGATDTTQSLGGGGRFAKLGSQTVVLYRTTVALAGNSTTVEVRVEAEGYAITEKAVALLGTSRVVRIDMPLTVSSTPLSVQRLNYPFRW